MQPLCACGWEYVVIEKRYRELWYLNICGWEYVVREKRYRELWYLNICGWEYVVREKQYIYLNICFFIPHCIMLVHCCRYLTQFDELCKLSYNVMCIDTSQHISRKVVRFSSVNVTWQNLLYRQSLKGTMQWILSVKNTCLLYQKKWSKCVRCCEFSCVCRANNFR